MEKIPSNPVISILPHCLAMGDVVVIGDMFRRMMCYVVRMHGVTQKLGRIVGGM